MTTAFTAAGPDTRGEIGFGTKAVAVGACIAAGMRVDLVKGINPGIVAMILLAPVWWPQVRRSRLVAWLVGLTAAALVSGLVLSWSVVNQRAVDWRTAGSSASLLALAFAGLVILLWARTVITVNAAVASFVVGVLLFQLSTPRVLAVNPWKFAFASPVTVLALVGVAWAARHAGRPRPGLTVVVLLVLAGVSATFDYRSQAAFLVLTGVLVLWQAYAVAGRKRLRALSPALLVVTVSGAVYLGATQLFVSGALGTAIQERSTQQIDASGSLLLGGRPEWAATVQLMGARPGGYGLGVLADSTDLQRAGNGFLAIHADPATGYEGYIADYMLANGFHLHSVAADLWAMSGFVGLLLAAVVFGTAVWALSSSLAIGRAEPLLVYTAIALLWDVAFSPLNSAVPDVVLGLFVAVVSHQYARAARATPGPDAVPVPPPAPSRQPSLLPGAGGGVLYGAAATAPDPNGGRRGSV